jgi:hypothetical protein
LAIRFNDPAIGDGLRTFFDWTGSSTGTSSPTVRAHDPLNPGTLIELPTRVVWELQSKGTVLLHVVIDIRWPSSPCVAGKSLFDIPEAADLTGYILGRDLVAKILNGIASASLSDTMGTARGNATGSGGGRSISGNAITTFTGTKVRSATSCGALENFDLSGFTASGAGSNTPDTIDLRLTGTDLVTDSNGILRSGKLDGNFAADGHPGTFSGTMDQNLPDKVPGHKLIIKFSDGTIDLADFFHVFFGKHPFP